LRPCIGSVTDGCVVTSIERRVRRDEAGRQNVSYVVRWRDTSRRQRARSFKRRTDAERFRSTVSADLIRGEYIDPAAGNVTFADYANLWLKAQTFDASTAEQVELRLRLHAFPALGNLRLRDVKPSIVQAWLRGLTSLAGSYQRVIFANVSTIFNAAVDDEVLAKNPCRATSVRRPKADPHKVIPWDRETVLKVRSYLSHRNAVVVTLAAGLGLRQGEVFALSADDVDFLRGRVEVRRQVKLFSSNRQVFALPKGRKTRTVPLPDSVRDDLAAHLTLFPIRSVTLPWETPDGPPLSVPLVLSTRERSAMNRNYFNVYVWKKALREAGVPPTRENGCHALRHFYASALLDAGESIKAVSEYLGHADPGFTLRTYTHLMPTSDERTRRAIDAALCVTGVYRDGSTAPKAQARGG
jgi:integrase